jgi:hypothetical protein
VQPTRFQVALDPITAKTGVRVERDHRRTKEAPFAVA